jgi:hypothetical protein
LILAWRPLSVCDFVEERFVGQFLFAGKTALVHGAGQLFVGQALL